jgi:hypothetical protein
VATPTAPAGGVTEVTIGDTASAESVMNTTSTQ